MQFFRRKLKAAQRSIQILRTRGLRAVIQAARDRFDRTALDAFDEQNNVETAGKVSLFELNISSQNESAGFRYQPSPAEICDAMFASLPIRHENYIFLDVGAGKGRALLIASRFPFKRVIGVEFAKELVEIARRNILRSGCRAEVVHADAAEYMFPDDNLVVYLYNPFGPEVLRPVLKSLQKISKNHDVYVLYLHAESALCVEEFATKLREFPDAKVYRFEQPAN
jgi:predicted RNA methylase